jgi:hypothetical protein
VVQWYHSGGRFVRTRVWSASTDDVIYSNDSISGLHQLPAGLLSLTSSLPLQRAVRAVDGAAAKSAVAVVVAESVSKLAFAGHRRRPHPISPSSSWASFVNRRAGDDPYWPLPSKPLADGQLAKERPPTEPQRTVPAGSLERRRWPYAVPPPAPCAVSLRRGKTACAFSSEHFARACAVEETMLSKSAQIRTESTAIAGCSGKKSQREYCTYQELQRHHIASKPLRRA